MGIGIYLLTALFGLIGWWVNNRLKSKFEEYSQVGLIAGLTGKQVAEKMLRDNNIFDVRVVSVEGMLTDHYNPVDKTVNLSEGVFNSISVSATAVAAHECGHAVQHATAYAMLGVRSSLVPVMNIANKFMPLALGIGVMVLYSTKNPLLLLIGIAMFAAATLFSLVTLPVEFDASKRALAWIDTNRVVTPQEHVMAKDALWWAAMTYVVAALSMVAQLLYYVSLLLGRRNNN
ncbi:MAG: zinc metallopeptidase [Pseudarcicella sp.]|nr:zinc metallopeptidase [Pseudarcicella sp.]